MRIDTAAFECDAFKDPARPHGGADSNSDSADAFE